MLIEYCNHIYINMPGNNNDSFLLSRNRCRVYQPTQLQTTTNGNITTTGPCSCPPGATGATGPAGNDGAQGPAGADGAQGPQGPAGNDGAQGPQGPAGADGGFGQYANSYNATVNHDNVSPTALDTHNAAVGDATFDGGNIILAHGGAAEYNNVHSISFTSTTLGGIVDNIFTWLQQKDIGDYIVISSETEPGLDFGVYLITSINGPVQGAHALNHNVFTFGVTCQGHGNTANIPAVGTQIDVGYIIMGQQGPPGNDGQDGAVGAQGPPGNDGQDGAVGPQGPPGNDGQDGAVGPQGPPGNDGQDGAVGPQGPPGNDGADGADGAPGPQGPPGADGADGAVGPQGPPGEPAKADHAIHFSRFPSGTGDGHEWPPNNNITHYSWKGALKFYNKNVDWNLGGAVPGWQETVGPGTSPHPGYLNSVENLGNGQPAVPPYDLPSFIFGIPADFGEGGGNGVSGTDIIFPSSINAFHHENVGPNNVQDEAPQAYMASAFPAFSPNTYPGYSVAHKSGEIVGYVINAWQPFGAPSASTTQSIPTTLSNVMVCAAVGTPAGPINPGTVAQNAFSDQQMGFKITATGSIVSPKVTLRNDPSVIAWTLSAVESFLPAVDQVNQSDQDETAFKSYGIPFDKGDLLFLFQSGGYSGNTTNPLPAWQEGGAFNCQLLVRYNE